MLFRVRVRRSLEEAGRESKVSGANCEWQDWAVVSSVGRRYEEAAG